jgi:hypothetical protein
MFTKEEFLIRTKACMYTRLELSKKGVTGPWMIEPDLFEFSAYGFPCIILRHPSLFHLCGYVGVPEDHPDFYKDYNELGGKYAAPGGLTFGDFGEYNDKRYKFFGFDCAHYADLSPSMLAYFGGHSEFEKRYLGNASYKSLKWVEGEVRRLAMQLFELAKN